jgi:hypothetical protein
MTLHEFTATSENVRSVNIQNPTTYVPITDIYRAKVGFIGGVELV